MVIIKNLRKGNGLIYLPKVKGFKMCPLCAGVNAVPVEHWELARTYPNIKKEIAKGYLVEMITKVEIPIKEKERVKNMLSFEAFCDSIESGKDGVVPETGGYFLVTLKGDLGSYRVKSIGEYARLEAYKQYVDEKGGILVEKVTAKALKSFNEEEKEALVKECFNIELLKTWKKSKVSSIAQLAREQLDLIDKYRK